MSEPSTPTSSVSPPEPVATSAAPASAAHAAAPAEPAPPEVLTTPSAAPSTEGDPHTPAASGASRWRGWQLRMPVSLENRESRQRLAIGLLIFLLALQWWTSRTDISDLRRELAQRLQSGENLNTQTKLIANRVDDEVKALQGKVAVLEAKQVESQGQQLALEQLYQDLAKKSRRLGAGRG